MSDGETNTRIFDGPSPQQAARVPAARMMELDVATPLAQAKERESMKPGCPFFGCHWPERSSTLQAGGKSECGLDLDFHGECGMVTKGLTVNYYACPLVAERRLQLAAAKQLIHFDAADGKALSLAEWEMRSRY
jgi:hypothetical protein